jgi:hypothetical protein
MLPITTQALHTPKTYLEKIEKIKIKNTKITHEM